MVDRLPDPQKSTVQQMFELTTTLQKLSQKALELGHAGQLRSSARITPHQKLIIHELTESILSNLHPSNPAAIDERCTKIDDLSRIIDEVHRASQTSGHQPRTPTQHSRKNSKTTP